MLFGDVWKRPGLSPRDRSLVTVASLVSLYRTNELPFHLAKALENGVTKDELIEVITHLAFYSGWPTANTAIAIARKVFGEARRKVSPDHARRSCCEETAFVRDGHSSLRHGDALGRDAGREPRARCRR